VANIKSQIKRNRQNDRKRLRNRVYRGEARIAVKNARTNIEESTPDSKAALQEAISALDKAVEQGVIHKNNAARRKSRLMKAYAKMGPAMVVAASAALEPAPVYEPVKKKAAPRRGAAKKKVEEPEVVAAEEPTTELKKSSPKGKKTAARKPAVKKAEIKKPADTSSPKGKKTTTRKKTTAKKES
jgi:small subunit ribosomal protein S20